jgi:hypothetical protein
LVVGRGVGWRAIGLLVAVFPEEKRPKPDYAASAGTSSQIDPSEHSFGTSAVAHGGQALIAKHSRLPHVTARSSSGIWAGKLEVLNVECEKCGRAGAVSARSPKRYGVNAKLFESSDEITADCP